MNVRRCFSGRGTGWTAGAVLALSCAARSVLVLWVTVLPLLAAGPEFLNFKELLALSDTNQPRGPLAGKLQAILGTPFVNNDAANAGVRPHRPTVEGAGPVLRAVCWNIERGLNFDLIRLALSDPDGFKEAAKRRGGFNRSNQEMIDLQLRKLLGADVIVLNEVDLGMKRTDYIDVTRELAHALEMNYAFGVEFVEVDRLDDLGVEKVQLGDPALAKQMQQELKPDPARYLGLHGNAILSRYPIQNARIVRLPVCHDWYGTEKLAISKLERGKRFAADKIFLARIGREVRVGGRMALIADLAIPDLQTHVATVVNAHLENKCPPECRTKQMDALLSEIKRIEHPVIVAGDMNTTGTDGTPTSVRREILKRLKNYEFWVTQALKWGTPASLPLAALTPVRYFKNYLDPTSIHLPVVGSNQEAIFFRHVEKFRFADQKTFDFRGEPERNSQDKEGTLANSNQRGLKGFTPTLTLARDFGGVVGRYKLDWFFIKPFIEQPRGEGMSYEFAPHFPLTMRDLNNAVPDGVSDHAPITVDLPLGNPPAIRPASSDRIRKAIITGGRGANGHCTISLDVDGAAEVEVSADTGVLTTLSGQAAAWRRFQCSQPLPRNPTDFNLVGINARGDIRLVRDPRANRGSAVIRVNDRKSGRATYTFDIQWRLFGWGQDWPSVPPTLPPSHYPGSGEAGSIQLCQDAVTDRLNRGGYRYVAFERTIPDRSPGRNDSIIGVVNGRRGFEVTRFSFSCSVDVWSGRIRSLDMQQHR